MLMAQTDAEKYQTQNSASIALLTPLVVQARAGSREAFAKLFDFFQESIFRLVYYRTRSRLDAEDLTQEIFIRAFKKLSGLKETNRFRTWLFSIAVNRVRDFQRKKRFRELYRNQPEDKETLRSDIPVYGCPQPLEELMKQDFWQQIGQYLNKLSPMEREVFLLRFLDHLSLKEISHVLKKSESTVKTHLYRALVKFKNSPSMIQLLQEESID
jgi:RNA polymerase sigma-70 factor (ECF subfamily)